MHFGYSIIYVASVPETLAFYDKAFGLQTGFLHESELYGELKPVPQPWLLRPMKWQR